MDSRDIASILDATKKKLGLDPEIITEFDSDIIDAINAEFSTLTEYGVGPPEGFEIHDESSVWTDYISDDIRQLNMVKSYIYAKVKLFFDPPQTSYLMTALQDQAKEYAWRLMTYNECSNDVYHSLDK